MKNFEEQLDITQNIKMIEILKCQILNSVADLNNSLLNCFENNEIKDIFADLIIISYILANRLSITPEDLKYKINKKLKLGILDNNSFNTDIKELFKYFNN